ncbi:MAG: hypothetical protein ACREN8_07980 [Candidatus Dormibacteraceae bacterium]
MKNATIGLQLEARDLVGVSWINRGLVNVHFTAPKAREGVEVGIVMPPERLRQLVELTEELKSPEVER